MAEPYEQRRERLWPLLSEVQADALLVSAAVNVRYLSGFTGGSSYLITSPNRTLLVSDGRFTAQIEEECPALEAHIRPLGMTTVEALGGVFDRLGVRAIGIEGNRLTVGELETLKEKIPSANWVATKGLVEKIRAVKEAAEVGTIRKAIVAAEEAYHEFRAQLGPDDTEYDLTDRIEHLMRKHGGRAASFEPITAVGDRSALAHAPATSRKLGSGAWLLLDWGTVVDGYVSDLTRIIIPNKPSIRSPYAPPLDLARLEAVYRAVLAARDRALELLQPGVATRDVDIAARKVIEDSGYGANFTHSLGHGIGLEVHESPHLRSNSDERLAEGNVVTVEPGIYLPGWGGVRIEDDVLVTADGPKVLSSLPRDLAAAYE